MRDATPQELRQIRMEYNGGGGSLPGKTQADAPPTGVADEANVSPVSPEDGRVGSVVRPTSSRLGSDKDETEVTSVSTARPIASQKSLKFEFVEGNRPRLK